MDNKFGPKVTSIFRAETSAKRYTWDKKSISHMHLRFSFCMHVNMHVDILMNFMRAKFQMAN